MPYLPDATLNEMCCTALGWTWHDYSTPPSDGPAGFWLDGEGKAYENPPFCSDLNMVQRYLIPHLRQLGWMAMDAWIWAVYAAFDRDPESEARQFDFMVAPARIRVEAYLHAIQQVI